MGLRLCRGWSRQPLPYFPQYFFLHFFFFVPCPHHGNPLLLSSPWLGQGPSLLPLTAVPRVSVLSPENRFLPHHLFRHQIPQRISPGSPSWTHRHGCLMVREGLSGGAETGLRAILRLPVAPLCLVPWGAGCACLSCGREADSNALTGVPEGSWPPLPFLPCLLPVPLVRFASVFDSSTYACLPPPRPRLLAP